MNRHVKACIVALSLSIVFLCIVLFITEFSPLSTRRATASISGSTLHEYRSAGGGLYYDPNTYTVYSEPNSASSYIVPVPLHDSFGRPYKYNIVTGEIEVVK